MTNSETKEGPAKVHCIERVYVPNSFRGVQCGNKNGFGPNGEYCKIHSPEGVAARKKRMDERWKIKQQRSPYTRLENATKEIIRLREEVATLTHKLADYEKEGLNG
jgi:hypothetical protein